MDPRRRALDLLCLIDPVTKAAQTRALFADLDGAAIDPAIVCDTPPHLPGRPTLPRLVPAKEVPARSPFCVLTVTASAVMVTESEICPT